MARINWDSVGKRFFNAGVDRCVLYTPGNLPVPWNGVVSISVEDSGDVKQFFIDGYNYLNIGSSSGFKGSLEAYYSPEEFDECDGSVALANGFLAMNQPRVPFSLSFRTLVGNDLESTDYGYKLHFITNILATPGEITSKSLDDGKDIDPLKWDLVARPSVISGAAPTAHIIIDQTVVTDEAITAIENILYGDDTTDPRMPTLDELSDIIVSSQTPPLIDNGDGTFTMTLKNNDVRMITDTQIDIDWNYGYRQINNDTYELSYEEG